jgi:hypothetical protein
MATSAQLFEQIGFEKMLLGLHYGIRHSRILAAANDDEKATSAILVFIDYLLQRIQSSSTMAIKPEAIEPEVQR